MAEREEGSVCDEEVFSKLYNDLAKDLHNYLYYRYGSIQDPKDKVQEAFIKLWKHCKEVSLETAKGFLFKVAKNMSLNELKHNKVVMNYAVEKPKNYTYESPEFLLEEHQFYEKYQQALGQLSEEQRTAFLLNKVDGKKHKEIAEMLDITKKVVEYRIYSAFKIIKKHIKEFK